MKRTALKRSSKSMKRTKIRLVGHSTVSDLKKEIQSLVREIVMIRDGGCILRFVRNCGGEIRQAVMQADHLISRANSATFADTRLIVCLCRPCHGGFKQWHKEQYDALVKSILPKETVALWDKCQQDSWRVSKKGAYDWNIEIVALKQELARIKNLSTD